MTWRGPRVVVRLAGAAAVATLAVALSPDPAAAHGVGGIRPSDYETVITGMHPPVRGVRVRAVDLGERLEITNDSQRDVIVLGYDGEPYLRVGPRGVFQNTRSPATYVNKTLRGTTRVPDRADPDAPPDWHRVGDAPVARWHDHRSHWTGRNDPPAVRDDPDHPHVVQRFRITLDDAGIRVGVSGLVRWVPAPSAWLWLGLAFILGAAVVAGSRTTFARIVLAVALIGVIVGETLHVAGAWGATTEGTGSRLGASVYALGAVAVAVVALVWVLRRGVHSAAPLVLLAGLFVAIAGGLADITVLTRSQVPTTLSYDLARAIVAAAIGLGIGLAVAGALRLRAEPRGLHRPPPAPAPTATTSVRP